MRTRHVFLIDSDPTGHQLSVDGLKIGTFTTLSAAESTAQHIAGGFGSRTSLRFGLDFKWTLSDWEIRAATLEC